MKSSLNRNLLIGFGFSILILIISSTASLVSITNLLKSAKKVTHSNLVSAQIDDILLIMVDAETGQRGFLLTNDEIFLEPFNGSYDRVMHTLDNLENSVSDNATQLSAMKDLRLMIKTRFSVLSHLINQKRNGEEINVASLRSGKAFMDSIRSFVQQTKNTERNLLEQRTLNMDKFADATPLFIVIATLLSLLITIVFYLKVKKDIKEKFDLQKALEAKDFSITKRIDIIENLANKISAGNFSIRVPDDEKDTLGNLSFSLNKMADSLDNSFKLLADKEWLQTSNAQLNETMIGDNDLQHLLENIMGFIAEKTNSLVGTFYLVDEDHFLSFRAGYAVNVNNIKKKLPFGEGLAGQCAATKNEIILNKIDESTLLINLTTVTVTPSNFFIFPVLFETAAIGVIEVGALHEYTPRELSFLRTISQNIGIAINTVQSRQHLQNLLEETQTQSEELITQHTELEHLNMELQNQWQKIQSSEEELRVQQEELMETNSILEERSVLLEQRNVIVQVKNAEIQQKIEELALSTKYKSEFLANMSHELRTPLNSILLLSQLLVENLQNNLTADQVKYASVIKSSGNGLLELIDEILDLSKIEAGKMTVDYSTFSMDLLRQNIMHLFEPLAMQNNLDWKIIIDTNVPTEIETDKLRLDQILRNLLSNAFKFTKKGFVHLTINCRPEKPDMLFFSIKDSGSGIAADKHNMIFEAFQQEDGSTRRKFGGTGLGLSISRQLAILLGGEITLTSVVGEGSDFTLFIPLKKINTPEIVKRAEEVSANLLTQNTFAGIAYNKNITGAKESFTDEIEDDRLDINEKDKVLLIIEDDTIFAKALLDYTRKKGYKGLVAVRGDKGLEMALKYKLKGILLDIQLPVKNGWQVIDELKNNPATCNIPVHMMSSFQAKKESLQKGAVNFINKPVAFEELNTIFDKIEYVLEKKEKKVLILEDNYKHAKALAFYLGTYNVKVAIDQNLEDGIISIQKKEVDCVILDIGVNEAKDYSILDAIRKNEAFKNIPIIIFTNKSFSQPEEFKLKKYADSIVLKTAHSYQRILDEVSLFLHLVEEQKTSNNINRSENTLQLENVLNNKTVLLADDDVRNIFALTKALEIHHLKIIPALDGKEALTLLNKNKGLIDIVLMDMMMPEMDGFETIKAMRSNHLTKHIPIIAVTAKSMQGDREKCIAAGASDYISKPVDIDQLISLLRIWLYEKSY